MMAEAACDCEAVAIHARRAGGGGGGGTGGWMAAGSTGLSAATGIGTMTASSEESSLFSSTSSLTDQEDEGEDGATSSPPAGPRHRVPSPSLSSSSLASSESETLQADGAAGGPLYELSIMMDHLPAARTGLSKYYHGRSQSFTSLADVSCVEDLAKKTTPYIRRPKASRRYASALGVKNRLSKTVAKKAHTGLKPPAYLLGKRELYR